MLSVIICTHNPRREYLVRVLASLQGQSFPMTEWELLLVDNASNEPAASTFDISWHPNGRFVREDELGLTPARLRGVAEACGEVLVFVDDDNVLDTNYLDEALRIGRDYRFLGAWGGGTIKPEFEQEPPAWTRAHWGNLAIREYKFPRWSNNPSDWHSLPCGAGLCVRREVAYEYAAAVKVDSVRRNLDRKGRSLISTGDIDLALTSSELNLGWGSFPSLIMTHLIPESRLSEQYLLKLSEGITASVIALRIRRGGEPPRLPSSWRQAVKTLIVFLAHGRRAARFRRAELRGRLLGARLAAEEFEFSPRC